MRLRLIVLYPKLTYLLFYEMTQQTDQIKKDFLIEHELFVILHVIICFLAISLFIFYSNTTRTSKND